MDFVNKFDYWQKIVSTLSQYDLTGRKIAIFPYGRIGQITEEILNTIYNISPSYIFDNGNKDGITKITRLEGDELSNRLKNENVLLILCSEWEGVYAEVRNIAHKYFEMDNIIDVLSPSIFFDKKMFFKDSYFYKYQPEFPRFSMLESCAREIYMNKVEGALAECGVYAGFFAGFMKRMFPDRKLYLFDTFEGFDDRDITEEEYNASSWFMENNNYLRNAPSLNEIVNRIPYNKNIIVKKGYFPNTALDDESVITEKYAFVDLDMDLYKPIYAGLDFFWERLSPGGYIMIDEIRCNELPSARKAVLDWCKKEKIAYSSITYKYPDGLVDATACIGKPL